MKKAIKIICAITAVFLLMSAYSFCLTVGAVNNQLTDKNGTVWELINEIKSTHGVLYTDIYTNAAGNLAYAVRSGEDTVIELSSLGVTLTDCDLSKGLKYNNDATQKRLPTNTSFLRLKAPFATIHASNRL